MTRKIPEVAKAQPSAVVKTHVKPVGKNRKTAPPKPGRSKEPAVVRHAVNKRDRCACQVRMPDGTKCGSRKWTHLHHIRKVSRRAAPPHDSANLLYRA